MLADVWMVPVDELVANNSATLADLDEPLKGKFLTVCGGEWRLWQLDECPERGWCPELLPAGSLMLRLRG
jgi:hypothetical protein